MKKLIFIFISFTLLSSISIPLSGKELDPKQNLGKIQTIQKLKTLSNGNLKLSEKGGQVFISGKLASKQVAGEKSASKFLQENKSLFGIDNATDELKTVEVKKDDIGHTYVKLAQLIKGTKVFGSLINVNFDKNGVIVSANGKLEKNKSVITLGNKAVSESDAVDIAKKQYTYKSLRNTPKSEKLILTKDNKNYEVFKVNISYTEPTIGNYDVFVEAHSGKVIQTENNIRYDESTTGSGTDVLGHTKILNLYKYGLSYQMKDLTKAASDIVTYSSKHTTSIPSGTLVSNKSSSFASEDYKASVSAHYNAGKVIDFYKNLFNRNSLDDKGLAIKSYTHYDTNYNNAFWDGYEMIYGDGDGYNFTYLSGDLGVVGHEMTHGVIDNTADLQYHNESGALNESMADVFGVLISTYDKYNVASGGNWVFNAADWVIGQDIYTPSIPGDALRSLSDPSLYDQPDNMNNYEYDPDTEDGDWGGVHINSGITSKAAYLVAKNIGLDKTAKIYYRALVTYMSPYTDFKQAENCLNEAATDLYGANSAEVKAINNAFYIVGVGEATASVTGVSLDKTTANLKVGGVITLVATISPIDALNKNVTWKSDNTSVATVNSTGKITAVGIGTTTITITTLDGGYTRTCLVTVIPNTPTSVKATSSSYNSVNVNWTAVTGASGYEVYRATTAAGANTYIAATTGANYNSIGLVTNSIYYYKVRAFRMVGSVKVYGAFSSVISTKPIPAAPTNAKATRASSKSIKITWNAVTGANGYEVYRATSSSGTYSLLKGITNLYYTNAGLLSGRTYYYKVRSYRTVGETKVYSNWGMIVHAKP